MSRLGDIYLVPLTTSTLEPIYGFDLSMSRPGDLEDLLSLILNVGPHLRVRLIDVADMKHQANYLLRIVLNLRPQSKGPTCRYHA